jgi:hydrogenase expression/formation protein HypC
VLSVDGPVATVDFWGTARSVRLELAAEPVEPGDHVLCHLGFALHRIPPEDVVEVMALYDD